MNIDKKSMSTRKATLIMALVSVMWSIAGVLIKYIDCNPIVIAGIRSFVAAMTVLVYMLISKTKFVINKQTLLNAVVCAMTFFSFVGANKLTSSANAIVIQYSAPVFVLLYQVIFKRQRPRINDVICVIITILGVAMFFKDSMGEGRVIGDLVAIIAALGFAGIFIVVGEADQVTSINGVLQGQLLTALVGIPFVFFTENTFDVQTVGLFLILGVVQLGIPYTLVAIAGPYCPALVSTVVTVFEPLLNPVWVALIYGEIPGVWSFIGGVVVIVNVLVYCVMRDKREAKLKQE
ncbi:MAG: DMT family transporter [Clostridia bacterium]|nr:DMT family transporter [Clostridia bacterium]